MITPFNTTIPGHQGRGGLFFGIVITSRADGKFGCCLCFLSFIRNIGAETQSYYRIQG